MYSPFLLLFLYRIKRVKKYLKIYDYEKVGSVFIVDIPSACFGTGQ